jgi:trehalose 6-phosphate synthase/phosphatase
MESLIIVSNRLPVTIGTKIEKSSGGLVYAMEGLGDSYDLKWVGWAGGVVNDLAERQKIAHELAERFNFIPIFLNKRDADDYYTGFSNSSLWPLLHYISPYARYEERWWQTYQRVNELFADTVSDLVQEGDSVWVHDYHLLLLPAYLRRRHPRPENRFFLHTPFPSYELFRCHPNREALLHGVLGANLIGFQTFGYLRHFRSTILRLLGLESEIDRVPQDSHKTKIGVYPIGINSVKFLRELQSEGYAKRYHEYKKNYQGKKIVLSVERLDYTKGIPRRMDAIERYLSKTDQRDDIVFIFINVPSRESVPEYQKLLEELQGKVGYINGKYATISNVPVHFIHKSVDFDELCALYSLADLAMVTPLIDGMNLVAKEYLACQQESAGVLILSEFAGAAQELPNSLIVNPYNINEVAQALKKALRLTEEEKQKMVKPMRDRVIKYDAKYWADSFFQDLAAEADMKRLPSVPSDTRAISLEAVSFLQQAQNISFFLDYDGTISEIRRRPEDAVPNHEIKELFARLEAHPNVDIYLISGRKKEDMDQWFSRYRFNLIAEHGFYYKHHNAAEWIVFDTQTDLSWKNKIIDVFQLYSGMTPGSSIEEKTFSVVWHYRNSDPEFGNWKANQLVAELYEMLSNLPVEIHHGEKIVEVGSMQVNKGIVVGHFVQLNKYDAVLCAGDNETDESMFRYRNAADMISIKVGAGTHTSAKFRISSPKAFRALLLDILDHLPIL